MRDAAEGSEPTEATGTPSGSRALVPVRNERAAPGSDARASADFVTQLLACAEHLAPFRRRRRAAAQTALATYAAEGRGGAVRARFQRVL